MSYGSAEVVSRRDGSVLAKLTAGNIYVTSQSIPILTVLGSCVSACIRDPVVGVGGMNHFMLPEGDTAKAEAWGDRAVLHRFGNLAMESLIQTLLHAGAVQERLEAKLFGGGRILDFSLDVGALNAEFAQDFLNRKGIAIDAMDVGQDYARKIVYEPGSGVVKLKKLRDVYTGYVAKTERNILRDAGSFAAEVRGITTGSPQGGA